MSKSKEHATEVATAPAAPYHLTMWEEMFKTDPRYTKQFTRSGGFSGTAINGTYIIMRLTEAFGPNGQGWRFVIDDEQIIEGRALKNGDRSKLHVIRGHIEYIIDGATYKTSPQFGQTMLVDENKYGTFMDEEAPKKSITDCISKCAVLLGIGADVHLGLFDDNKYVNQRRAEIAADEKAKAAEAAPALPAAPASSGDTTPVEEAAAEHGISGAGLDAPPTKEETAFARTVFEAVKSMVAAATDEGDIDTCLKANKDGLKLLEAKFNNNYQKLKGIVTDRREALKGNIPA